MGQHLEWVDPACVNYVDEAGEIDNGDARNDGPCIASDGDGFVIEPAGYPATTPAQGREQLRKMLLRLLAAVDAADERDAREAG